jgi:hypothetical protein
MAEAEDNLRFPVCSLAFISGDGPAAPPASPFGTDEGVDRIWLQEEYFVFNVSSYRASYDAEPIRLLAPKTLSLKVHATGAACRSAAASCVFHLEHGDVIRFQQRIRADVKELYGRKTRRG